MNKLIEINGELVIMHRPSNFRRVQISKTVGRYFQNKTASHFILLGGLIEFEYKTELAKLAELADNCQL